MKKRKITLIIILAVLFLCIVGSTLAMTLGMGGGKKILDSFDGKKVLTTSEVKSDATELVYKTEATHPKFALNMVNKERYITAKTALLALNASMTAYDFSLEAAKYLSVLDDLHTSASIQMNLSDYIYDMDISISFDSTKMMFVLSSDEQNFIPKGAALVEIGGKKIDEITSVLRDFFSTETNAFSSKNALLHPKMLELSGLKTSSNTMDFSFEKDGEVYTRNFKAILISDYQFKHSQNSPIITNKRKNFSTEQNDDILLIKIASCVDDGSYENCKKTIKNFVKSGKKNVVIDVRGNGGGNDGYCMEILSDLGFTYSKVGFNYRYSKLTRTHRNTVRMTGISSVPFKYRSKNKNEIKLKVLMDEETYSAAMTMVSLVKYSNLGEIIGRPSLQGSNYCGNAITLQLPNSKTTYRLPVSYNYYEKDGKLAEMILSPDIIVPFTENYEGYISFK